MTPQEKAMQLISKFVSLGFTLWVSKQCALIAVDEVINLLTKDINPLINYWFEVKEEIEKI